MSTLYVPPNQRPGYQGTGAVQNNTGPDSSGTFLYNRYWEGYSKNKSHDSVDWFYPAKGYPHLHLRLRGASCTTTPRTLDFLVLSYGNQANGQYSTRIYKDGTTYGRKNDFPKVWQVFRDSDGYEFANKVIRKIEEALTLAD